MGALERAIQIIGGPKEVASVFGLKSTMAISHWKRRGVPAGYVIKLCELTEWKVRPNDLAPLIYPHPDDGIPTWLRGATDM
ncbi:YdaS family helix-turn-helix protein [Pseudomonadota bacterium]